MRTITAAPGGNSAQFDVVAAAILAGGAGSGWGMANTIAATRAADEASRLEIMRRENIERGTLGRLVGPFSIFR